MTGDPRIEKLMIPVREALSKHLATKEVQGKWMRNRRKEYYDR